LGKEKGRLGGRLAYWTGRSHLGLYRALDAGLYRKKGKKGGEGRTFYQKKSVNVQKKLPQTQSGDRLDGKRGGCVVVQVNR